MVFGKSPLTDFLRGGRPTGQRAGRAAVGRPGGEFGRLDVDPGDIYISCGLAGARARAAEQIQVSPEDVRAAANIV